MSGVRLGSSTRRHGRDRRGHQIYECTRCHRRFTALTDTAFSGHRFPPDVIAVAVLAPAVQAVLCRGGRAPGRARRPGRPVNGLRLGRRSSRPCSRRPPVPTGHRSVGVERGRDLCPRGRRVVLRLPGDHEHGQVVDVPSASTAGRPTTRRLLPARDRGDGCHPDRPVTTDRAAGLPAGAGRGAARGRARGGQARPAADRARPWAPEGAAAADARLPDARRRAGAVRRPRARPQPQPAASIGWERWRIRSPAAHHCSCAPGTSSPRRCWSGSEPRRVDAPSRALATAPSLPTDPSATQRHRAATAGRGKGEHRNSRISQGISGEPTTGIEPATCSFQPRPLPVALQRDVIFLNV